MRPFETLTAVAAPIDAINVDTDQILPARYLRRPRDDRYPAYLFHDLRYDVDGNEIADFVLNRPAFRTARILVAGRNFGCGSSREAAVFALDANDIRCVIAPSFGDIFFNNCFSNGVLPVRLEEEVCERLRGQLNAEPGVAMSVDLNGEIATGPDGTDYAFEVDPFRKHCLLNGLDDIALTLEYESGIAAFEERYRDEMRWLF